MTHMPQAKPDKSCTSVRDKRIHILSIEMCPHVPQHTAMFVWSDLMCLCVPAASVALLIFCMSLYFTILVMSAMIEAFTSLEKAAKGMNLFIEKHTKGSIKDIYQALHR